MTRLTQNLIQPTESVISSNRSNAQYDIMAFPSKLGPHSIVFNFTKYEYSASAKKTSELTTKSVCLPLPTNLTDSFNIRVAGVELGALGTMAAESSSEIMGMLDRGGDAVGVMDYVTGLSAAADRSGFGAGYLLRQAVEKADTGVIKGVEAATGIANNPNLALTFDGVDLKQHNFQWTLAPQSAEESERLKKIINYLKKSSLPTFRSGFGKAFFNFPNVVDVFFLGSEPGYLYAFKRCMVNNLEFNYAGAGTPAFVEGGRPAVVNVTMNLMEMDIHTAEDYPEGV